IVGIPRRSLVLAAPADPRELLAGARTCAVSSRAAAIFSRHCPYIRPMSGTAGEMARLAAGGTRLRDVSMANRLVLTAGVPIFLVLATIAYITVQFAANENKAQRWVAHTYQVIASLRVVLGDAQDAETGQRGYILTRQPSFLQPYETARARVERDLNRF